ncbi:MAG: protein-methionine-sulfoxide reductase catalytic subunit MsrP, partial [Deltaproteobacteria bacterium]|nr:protein-methionine-sulfoxide reductase catalytic subunit MsrP [Deltaproteobacteria bacterium]
NNFYEFSLDKNKVHELARDLPISPWEVEIGGLVKKKKRVDVSDLIKLFGTEQRIYRFRCVEAWSMVVPWDGFPFSKLLKWAEPLSTARYVIMTTFYYPKIAQGQRNPLYPWPYTEGLSLKEAANDLAFLSTGIYGEKLPPQNGAPLRLVVPWKYGFKSIKSIVKIEFAREQPKTLWHQLAPAEYGFNANVNPQVDHPRWSQASEKPLGSWFNKIDTLMFNGYEKEVASLYRGLDLNKNY